MSYSELSAYYQDVDLGCYISINGEPMTCIDCEILKGLGHRSDCKYYNPPIKVKFESPKDYQDRQAFDLLYNTFIEVGEILERGIKDGEKGYKNAIYKAREKIRLVT